MSGGRALPEDVRRERFARLGRLAGDAGLRVHLCGCKNPDLTVERCDLVRNTAGRPTAGSLQSESLFAFGAG